MDSYDLDIYKGATFSLSLTLNDTAGNPIDLTNYSISGFLKFRYSDTGKLVSLNPSGISPLTSGNVLLSIHATGTEVLPVTYGVYDLEIRHNTSGTVDKVLNGRARIHPEVTF
jgi:hypothetical protein